MGAAYLLLGILLFWGSDDLEEILARDCPTTDEAARLLRALDHCPEALKPRVRSLLSRGGPWLPALIDALPASRDLIRDAFEKRPMRYELPPPGEAATTEIDLFGNGRTGEGTGLAFPGTWPGPVKLSVFLDRVNRAARPALPFVLSPLVEDPVVERKPLSGAAVFVMDSVLARLGLKVTFLETVTLVSRNGGSCYGQTRVQQKRDDLLLGEALDVLSRSHGDRSRALAALALLDVPGLFDGYCRELERGRLRPALDLLLVGRQADRLRLRLIESNGLGFLGLAHETNGPGSKLERFLETLPPRLLKDSTTDFVLRARCGLVSSREVLARIESDRAEEGLRAARYLGPEAKDDLLSLLVAWPPSNCTGLVETLLVQTLTVDDRQAATLILNEGTRNAGLMLAGTVGGPHCLAALKSLHDQGTGNLDTVRSAARLMKHGRPVPLNPDQSCESRILAAGVLAALGEDEAAAPFLLEQLATGSERAAEMFSFFRGGRILPYLGALGAHGGPAGERAVLRAAQDSVVAAERIRLALKADEGNPLFLRLNDRLALLAMVSTRESYFVAVDF
jgi:hypothetical protein